MESPISTSAACAYCQQPATLTCGACKDAPRYEEKHDPKATRYCSKACQRLDWVQHKGLCKTLKVRKIFSRAGSVVQDVFYKYRELLFDLNVQRIEATKSTMYVHEAAYPNGPYASVLFPFPATLVPNAQDRQALLAHMSCTDTVSWLHDVTKYIVEDTIEMATEMCVLPKDKTRNVVTVWNGGDTQDNNGNPHNFLLIKLKNGEEWALDVSSAQYGHYEPVTPFKSYWESRVAVNLSSRDNMPTLWGNGKTVALSLMSFGGDYMEGVFKLNFKASEVLVSATKEWEQVTGTSISHMLALSESGFKEKRQGLVDYVGMELVSHLQARSLQKAA